MKSINKQILWLILLGCMMLPKEQVQASSPLFFGSNGDSASPTSVAGFNFDEKLTEHQIIQFLEFRLAAMDVADDLNVNLIARAMQGYLLSEIEEILDEVQQLALQDNSQVTMQYFDDVYLNVRRGLQDAWFDEEYNPETAIHEAGHIVAALYKLKNDQILHDVTIKSRGKSLGETISYSLFESAPASVKTDNDVLQNRIIFCLSGGVANQIFSSFGDLNYKSFENFIAVFENSTDAEQARKYARAIVMKKLRASNKFSFITDHDETSIAKEIDRIIEDCYDLAWSFIKYHKNDVIKIADLLVVKGRVSGDEIYNLLEMHKPLYDFEQGPLPKSLVANYVLRGHALEADDDDDVLELY